MEETKKNDNVFNAVPCAEEIVKVLEKHEVSVFNMEKVFAVAHDIAITNTKIQSGQTPKSEDLMRRVGKNPFGL